MKTFAFVLLAGLWVAGCSHSELAQRNRSSHLYPPLVGTTIELLKPLEVPPGHTRVFLQRGDVVSKQAFDRYVPNCNFEIRTLSEQVRKITPEPFLVTRVQRVTVEVVQLAMPIMVAGLNLVVADASQPMVARGLHLWIGSDLQPDVMRLTCRGAFDDPWEAELPSIKQMREALGSYATVELPGGDSL